MKHIISPLGVMLFLLLGIIPITAGDNDYCFDKTLQLTPGGYSASVFIGRTDLDFTDPAFGIGGSATAMAYYDGVLFSTPYTWTPGGGSQGFATSNAQHTIRVTVRFAPPDDRDIYYIDTVFTDEFGTIIAQETQHRRCSELNGDDDIVLPPDDRANWQLGDDIAVIYSVNDSQNNPALHIYQPNTEGVNPNRPLVITRADLPRPMPPAQDTWIAGEGLVNVYVLTTGEIQFNIGPTPDGKMRVVIFPDFTGEGAYGYEYFVDEQTPAFNGETTTITSDDNPAADVLCRFLVLSSDC